MSSNDWTILITLLRTHFYYTDNIARNTSKNYCIHVVSSVAVCCNLLVACCMHWITWGTVWFSVLCTAVCCDLTAAFCAPYFAWRNCCLLYSCVLESYGCLPWPCFWRHYLRKFVRLQVYCTAACHSLWICVPCAWFNLKECILLCLLYNWVFRVLRDACPSLFFLEPCLKNCRFTVELCVTA